MVDEITPTQALAMNQQGALIIDVRELWELHIASIPSAIHIPMNRIDDHLNQLIQWAKNHALLILCHHGWRSLQVAYYLDQYNIGTLYNIKGGCDAWSVELDESVARY